MILLAVSLPPMYCAVWYIDSLYEVGRSTSHGACFCWFGLSMRWPGGGGGSSV